MMRTKRRATTACCGVFALFALAACETEISEEFKTQDTGPTNVIDATNLNDIMLTVGNPDAAVDYFRAGLAREPERLDFKRGYAQSLVRAGRHAEAVLVYRQLVEDGDANATDRLLFSQSLVRRSAFAEAEEQIALVPPSENSFRYNLIQALLADNREEWAAADQYYDAARRLTTRPAGTLNNWGLSHRVRGDSQRAVELFEEAITFDPDLFEAKNNLVITRGVEGIYTLPVIPMTETERALLLHNLAVIALRRNDLDVARGLLEEAVDTHPQFFTAAAEKLDALGGPVAR